MKFTTAKKLARTAGAAAAACMTFAGGAFAAGTTTTGTSTTGTAATSTSAGMIQFIISMIILFAIFYFLMIRPENKRKKKVEEMRSGLKNGDDVITIGGIRGKIVGISGDNITFETGEDRVRIQVAKWAISERSGKEKAKESGDKEK